MAEKPKRLKHEDRIKDLESTREQRIVELLHLKGQISDIYSELDALRMERVRKHWEEIHSKPWWQFWR